ncbi:hypothetical protein C1T31_05675 [Hanstruepera neustonica]|uniref:CUB domain-containing protein n=1 Tax=Hanstruepera neustonica TaxID=1445657 RepID=A0A2K1E0K4_9FLAO|nr:T9SS type A sorting domain-containing protein [Hanstruepera neustonica]PNQ73820.1 hypothetical protein C1T31_05675 [Hanstruepera neustonica]
MKKINTFFRGIAFVLFSMFALSGFSQCNFTLEMNDSYGDGWNGNSLDLFVNGGLVLDNATFSGFGNYQATLNFGVTTGDAITVVWNGGGSYGYETSYRILDNTGNAVASAAQSGVSATAVCAVATSYCERDPGNLTDGQGITALDLGSESFDLSSTDAAYYDLTGTPVVFQAGLQGNVIITFATGSYEYDVDIWIDVNDDFTFDSSEQFFDGVVPDGNGNGTFNASFTFPGDLGSHTMRIGTGDFPGYYNGDPCYDGNWGVTVDAAIEIIEPLCQPATIGDTTIQPDCNPENPVFFVNVDVQQGADAVSITDGVSNFPILSTGNNQVGPFASGTPVTLTVVHSDAECNINLGEFVYNCPPPNDTCGYAEAIVCGDVKTGSTEYANSESLADCDGLGISSGNGVWYSLVGTGGDIVVDLSGSDFDTKLAIFSGSCGALVCEASDDDGGTGLDSRLTFGSVMGTTYYVYVTGFSSFSSGDYVISIDCICDAYIEQGECVKLFTGYGPTSSTDLTAVGQFGLAPYTYEWSTGETTATINVAPTSQTDYMVTVTDAAGCTQVINTTVLVQDISCQDNGNPNNAKVNVCHDGEPLCVSTNAVQAHLNHGDSLGACDDLVDCNTIPLCDARLKVPAPMATDVDASIEISWGAATGYVQGYLLSVGTTAGGTDVLNAVDVGYVLDYSLDGLLDFNTTYHVTIVPYNNIGVGESCESSYFTTESGPWCVATPIDCNSSTDGNVNDGEINSYLTSCGGSSFTSINDAPGVWYSFTGTGYDVEVSLCGATWDTTLGIYEGDCSSLNCVDVDDDGCPFGGSGSSLASTSTIPTTEGATYYVFVTSFSPTTSGRGPFTLNLTCAGPPPVLPACEAATSIECGQTLSGTNAGGAVFNDLGTCTTNFSTNNAPGVFYKIEGTGELLIASTCNAASSGFDTKIGVFTSDDCALFTCVAGNDDSSGCSGGTSEVAFPTEAGTTYFIYVTGFNSGDIGTFDLTVTCSEPPAPEDVCGGIYVDSGGVLGNYSTNELRTTTISPDVAGEAVTITFTYVDIESSSFGNGTNSCWDFLTIYNGPSTSSPVLAQTLCGEESGDGGAPSNASSLLSVGMSFTSTDPSGALTIVFDSDSSVNETGWVADITCGSSNRTISSSTADWSLYPNPATNGEVQLDLSNYLNQDVSIQMMDFSGKVLVNKDEPNLQTPRYRLSTSGMAYGMYFVRVATPSGVSTKKLMIANN